MTCNFIKKETLAHVFSSEFCKISKNPLFYRTAPLAAFGNWLVLSKYQRKSCLTSFVR